MLRAWRSRSTAWRQSPRERRRSPPGNPPESAYPEAVGLTPANVPRAERSGRSTGHLGTSDLAKARLLTQTVPHCFSFAFDSRNGKGLATFRALAHGDLDGDGIHSTFAISGEFREGSEPRTLPMEIDREIE